MDKAIIAQVSKILNPFRLGASYPVTGFLQKGFNIKSFMKDIVEWPEDKSGIYFFRLQGCSKNEAHTMLGRKALSEVIYVGRSRKICQRLSGHFKSNKHNAASLVYRITCDKRDSKHKTRESNMGTKAFEKEFDQIRKFLARHVQVSFHFEADPVRQALLEILFSQKFQTTFNEWETH